MTDFLCGHSFCVFGFRLTPWIRTLHCRGEYKRWSNESMALAVDAVMKDGLSVRRAAKVYNVSKSTLGDHISGRVLPGSVGQSGT